LSQIIQIENMHYSGMKLATEIILIILLGFSVENSYCQNTATDTFRINKSIYVTIAGRGSGTIKRQIVLDSGKVVLHGCPGCTILGFEMIGIKYSLKPDRVILAIRKSYNKRTGALIKSDTSFDLHQAMWDSNEDAKPWHNSITKNYNKYTGELVAVSKYDQSIFNPNDGHKNFGHILVVEKSKISTGERYVDTTKIFEQYNLHLKSPGDNLTVEMQEAINNQYGINVGGIGIFNIRILTAQGEEKMIYDDKYLTLYFQ
jgi:hypothetical protein